MATRVPVIAVTTGDPAGVGPEIVLRYFRSERPKRSIACLIGARTTFEPLPAAWRILEGAPPAGTWPYPAGTIVMLDTGCRRRYATGRDSRAGGEHAGRAIEAACDLANAGRIDGIVTAPISKASINQAGYRFSGHTEMFATRFSRRDCQMVMVYGRFRVVPITRHIPLADVPAVLTEERIFTAIMVVENALREQFGIPAPHLAVSALNPHGGEGGLLGSEEGAMIEPALRRARSRGIRVSGPIPGDALFQLGGPGEGGTFDAFLTMYHDQGLIPFKMRAKRRGVNVTVGLPVVRTSVDHGVAYDIAGKGIASTRSFGAAYRLAERLVRRRIIALRR